MNKIDKIYEEIASKELSFWCKFSFEEEIANYCKLDNIYTITWFDYDSHDEEYSNKADFITEIFWISKYLMSHNWWHIITRNIEHEEENLTDDQKNLVNGVSINQNAIKLFDTVLSALQKDGAVKLGDLREALAAKSNGKDA